MFTKDNIIKIGLAIVCLAVTIPLVMEESPGWIILLFSPLLLIPIARDFRLIKDTDEKQTMDQYKSSHVALYLVMGYYMIDALVRYFNKETVDYSLCTIILIVFITKTLMGISSSFSFQKAGIFLSGIAGALWFMVSISISLAQEFLPFHLLIGLCFLTASLISIKWRVAGAVILAILGIILFFYPVPIFQIMNRFNFFLMIMTFFPLPALISSFLLLRQREEEEEDKLPAAQAATN